MKLINLNFLISIILLSFTDKHYTISKATIKTQPKDLSTSIIYDIKNLNQNITDLYNDITASLNTTNHTEIDNTLITLKEYHTSLDKKIKQFEDNVLHTNIIKQKNLKKRKSTEDNRFNFYNSISLIMLGLLAGGLVGVVFILYFSFKNQDKGELEQ